ncbi:hypothetical protein [Kitasatospora sp. NPDC087271]|uniref:hypothetical protein n=1 Tax=Kitasatospora sp. NPDC087271 TaxID=3364067 RepID=UPI0038122953
MSRLFGGRGGGRGDEGSGSTQELARSLARQGAWGGLWKLVLSLPFPQAAAAAAHLKPSRWQPQGMAERQLAQLLAETDRREVVRVGESVHASASRVLPSALNAAGPVGFCHQLPLAAINLIGEDLHRCRIVTVDRTGVLNEFYEGPTNHVSLCCVDADTVVALRDFAGDGHLRNAELVEYTPGGETVLAGGTALLGARVEATADGFVTGLRLVRAALGFFGGQELQLDLAEFGFNRADLFAVDPSGTRIAFADGFRILITDSRLEPMHEFAADDHLGHGPISAIAFTADSLVTAGLDRGLQRWQVVGDRLRPLHPASFPPPRALHRLSPVPAWGLLVGDGGNENFFYDQTSLDSRTSPPFLGSLDTGIGHFESAPYGRLAVYEGGLFPPTRDSADGFYSTVVLDLDHPLNLLARRLSSLSRADADRSRATRADAGRYPLSDSARNVLDRIEAAAELVPELAR